MQRTAILNGSNINYDKDYSLLAKSIINQGVVEGLEVTTNSVSAGKGFIEVVRTSIVPNETFYIVFENTTAVTIDTTGTKKVFVSIPKQNVNDPGYNQASGENIATIQTRASYPTEDYIPLASITAGVITDERVFIKPKAEIEERGILLPKCTLQTKSANYTFDGTEKNNVGFSTDTTTGNITYTLDLSLFPTTNGLYEFTFCKSTGDTNKVIINVGSGNTIDNSQTYELTTQWETVTIKIISSTFAKVTSTSNKPTPSPVVASTKSTFVAGENITAPAYVRKGVASLGEDTTKIYKTDASNILKINAIGSIGNSVTSGISVNVDTGGVSNYWTGLITNSNYYLNCGNNILDEHSYNFNNTSSLANGGVVFITKGNLLLTTVIKSTSCTAPTCQLRNGAGTLLASVSFVGTIATFNIALDNNATYSLNAYNGGNNFTNHMNFTNPTFPINDTNINWTGLYGTYFSNITGINTALAIPGRISVNHGEMGARIGKSISVTEIEMETAFNNSVDSIILGLQWNLSQTLVVNHNLGKIPKRIDFNLISPATNPYISMGAFKRGDNKCIYGATSAISASNNARCFQDSSGFNGYVSAVTETTFTLVIGAGGSAGTANILATLIG